MNAASSPFRESAEARAMQKHIEDVTWAFISRWRNQRSVSGELAIINDIANVAISSAVSKWNEQRGYAQRLPMELILRSWSYLDIPDLLRATTVCKAWREASTNAQELWTCLDLLAWKFLPRSSLPDLLARSGNRRLTLRVCTRGAHDVDLLGRYLQPHAYRVSRLHVESAWRLPVDLPFTFHMPALQSLTAGSISCALLAGKAPFLREAKFHVLQGGHAALEHLASLTVDDFRGLEYRTLPNLTYIEVRNRSTIGDLQHVPRKSRLCHAVFSQYCGSYAELDDAGYTRLHKLEVGLPDSSVLWEILNSWAHVSSRPTLEILADNCVSLMMAPYNNSLTFRCGFVAKGDVQQLYQHKFLENLVNVAFPPPGDFVIKGSSYYTGYSSGTVTLPQDLLVLPRGTLPNLQTYTVYHAPPRSPSLLDVDSMHGCGELHAPALRTLVIRRSPCATVAEDVAPVCPSRLALFIAKHLRFDAEILHEFVLVGVHAGGIRRWRRCGGRAGELRAHHYDACNCPWRTKLRC